MRSLLLAAAVLALCPASGCARGSQASGEVAATVAPSSPAPSPVPPGAAPAPAAAGAQPAASPPFGDGARAFAAVREALLQRYVGAPVSEEALYRAAVQGMLEHVDGRRTSWNKLLDPAELAALRDDMRGEVVGIGAQIRFDEASGTTEVQRVFAGSPAERAGLLAGDRILDIDGRFYKGRSGADVLADIRGKAGQPVVLAVLRDDKVLSVTATRGVVVYDVVEQAVLPDAIGYLRVRAFNDRTAAAVESAMQRLAEASVRRLIVDLRSNPGGGFDDAIATAGAWIPRGSPVVRSVGSGDKERVYTSSGSPRLAALPMAVLVDGATSSSGEFIAAALQEGRQALLVGTRTFGKWSLQTLDDLPNGYAAKYTVGVLRSGAGRALDGVGLTPDVEVESDPKIAPAPVASADPARRVAADAPLRAAVALLRSR